MIAQECPPALRWRSSAPDHVYRDRRFGDGILSTLSRKPKRPDPPDWRKRRAEARHNAPGDDASCLIGCSLFQIQILCRGSRDHSAPLR
jgi:hypothetical protein